MKSTIQAVKGTRDFYPEDMALRSWLYSNVRQVSESFGYQEWDAPYLETIELYASKSGEELVEKQSFVFPDRSGELIALRPELTPSLARMVAQRQRQLVYPLRWWSWGPFWRYERPQKGRSREFFQWNIDLIGVDTPQADAELAAVAAGLFRQTGLSPSQVKILVNNRKLVEAQLNQLRITPELHTQVFRLIDRLDKLPTVQWEAHAAELGLTSPQIDGLKKMLTNEALWSQSPDLEIFFEAVDALGVSEYIRYAPHIIRGLDYYTGTVFETWDNDGEFRAVLGGGRYDNLVSAVGGEPLPAVGFAMGDMVISLVLKKFGCLPAGLGSSPAQVLVTVFDEASLVTSLALATQLRQAGINVACYPEAAKLAKQIKYGDRMGMRLALVVGPDEQANGTVTLKDMRSGEQMLVSRDLAANEIIRILR